MYVDTIRARDVDKYCINEKAVIVDLRSRHEYEVMHIPNAINIPYEDLDDHIGTFRKWENVILYCSRGNLSLLAARELAKECNGHMISVGGGFNAYRQYHKQQKKS